MKARRIFRVNRKSPKERTREQVLRDQLQKDKPALDGLIRAGECQSALQGLKKEREKRGLSIGEVAQRSGLDRAFVSRLENGKQHNPSVAKARRRGSRGS